MKHPGFKSVQNSIAKKEGVSKERAGAILAASTRRASAKAKKANPNLKKVLGASRHDEYEKHETKVANAMKTGSCY